MKYTQEQILQQDNIVDFTQHLEASQCDLCTLCQHDNRIVTHRGNPFSDIMLVGEGPGKIEDKEGKAFVGPAGELLDKILESIGLFTPSDLYLSNCVRCRPVAPQGSGKENYTPLQSQRTKCLPYLRREIELINPKIIIAAGASAAKALFDLRSNTRMGDIAGKFIQVDDPLFQDRKCFVIYHPAWMLHEKRKGPEGYEQAKRIMWRHIKTLKRTLDQMDLIPKEDN